MNRHFPRGILGNSAARHSFEIANRSERRFANDVHRRRCIPGSHRQCTEALIQKPPVVPRLNVNDPINRPDRLRSIDRKRRSN
jgi:hypothetical protein